MSEYQERTHRLTEIISKDPELTEHLRQAFVGAYEEQSVPAHSGIISDCKLIGAGRHHIIIGVERTLIDPTNNREISLALRLRHDGNPYIKGRVLERYFLEEIGSFDRAFEQELNPPYFVAAVQAEVEIKGRRKTLLGILLEDVSFSGKYEINSVPKADDNLNGHFFIRKNPNGTIERFFLDPNDFARAAQGKPYLNEGMLLKL